MKPVKISLDAMGGDYGPSVVVPAALEALHRHPELQIVLVGDEAVIKQHLKVAASSIKQLQSERIEIQHASEQVAMDESPSVALRTKKDSSMRVAINLVKEQVVEACVSAGNTGALMATARYVLKTIPGIDRPAIISAVPSTAGHVYMLDLGANVECHAEHLYQFAVMGSILASAMLHIPKPTVGLLNVGAEAIKGSDQVKRAAQLLSESETINYVGFIEGDDIYKGTTSVVVCDGFAGNITLKASEGLAKFLSNAVKQSYKKNIFTALIGLLSRPILKEFLRDYDPGKFNGASFLGLSGIVIKSHGGADINAFANAISVALLEVENSVPDKIRQEVRSHLLDSSLTDPGTNKGGASASGTSNPGSSNKVAI